MTVTVRIQSTEPTPHADWVYLINKIKIRTRLYHVESKFYSLLYMSHRASLMDSGHGHHYVGIMSNNVAVTVLLSLTRVSFDSEPTRTRHWERSVLKCWENREVEKAWDPFLPYLSISVFAVFITSKTKAKWCISRRLQASNVSSWFFHGTITASPVRHFELFSLSLCLSVKHM